MTDAIKYLRKREWSMGNGQCPECCGAPEDWYGHPCHRTPDTIGHDRACPLAAALAALGEKPLYKGDFKTDVELEDCISEVGFLGVRPKTKDGCPRYKAWAEEMDRRIGSLILRKVREKTSDD